MTTALPPELWERIFRFAAVDHRDGAWVPFWVTGRQVSHFWRDSIAAAYRDALLRHPKRCVIWFDCDGGYVQARKCMFAVEMFFDRIDEKNKARCVFREGEKTGRDLSGHKDQEYATEYNEAKYRIWEEKLSVYLDEDCECYDMTPYVLSIYGLSMDSELPGLAYDVERREISFEWEAMFSKFCYEYSELDKRNTSTAEELGTANRGIMELDGPSQTKAIVNFVKAIHLSLGNNVKAVRRQRIKRLCKDRQGFDFDDWNEVYEKEQIERIQNAVGIGKDQDEDEDEDEEMVDDDFFDEWETESEMEVNDDEDEDE